MKKKRKFGFLKSGGKQKKEFGYPVKLLCQKYRFEIFNSHLKEIQKNVKKYFKSSHVYTEDEKHLAVIFHQRALKQYDVTFEGCDPEPKRLFEETWNNFTEKEHDKIAELKDVFSYVSHSLERVGEERKQLRGLVKEHLQGMVSSILVQQKEGMKMTHKFETSMKEITHLKQKVLSLEKTLEKTEKKSQKRKGMKDKEKSKRTEESIMRKLEVKREELEEFKKTASFTEQQTYDEMEFQQNLMENEYVQSLREMVLDYRKFFENGLRIMNGVIEDLDVMKNVGTFQSSRRKRETVVTTVRDCFLPKKKTKIYETPVEEVMRRKEERGKIPKAIEDLFQFLHVRVKTEGIFRKVGKKESIEYRKRHIDQGEMNQTYKDHEVHTVGSLLKLYFRELPGSVCNIELFQPCFKTPDDDSCVAEIKKSVANLSGARRYLLYRLLKLLKAVESEKASNLMNRTNIVLVWSVNMCRPLDVNPMAIVQLTPKINRMCEVMLEYYDEIFPREPGVFFEKELDFNERALIRQKEMEIERKKLNAPAKRAPAEDGRKVQQIMGGEDKKGDGDHLPLPPDEEEYLDDVPMRMASLPERKKKKKLPLPTAPKVQLPTALAHPIPVPQQKKAAAVRKKREIVEEEDDSDEISSDSLSSDEEEEAEDEEKPAAQPQEEDVKNVDGQEAEAKELEVASTLPPPRRNMNRRLPGRRPKLRDRRVHNLRETNPFAKSGGRPISMNVPVTLPGKLKAAEGKRKRKSLPKPPKD